MHICTMFTLKNTIKNTKEKIYFVHYRCMIVLLNSINDLGGPGHPR